MVLIQHFVLHSVCRSRHDALLYCGNGQNFLIKSMDGKFEI